MSGEGDNESWLTDWEQECVDGIDGQPDLEQSLQTECDNLHTKIWTVFQESAAAIAQLYRDRASGEPSALWFQFQTAAGTITTLYKDSFDSCKKLNEIAKNCGYQRRNKELLNWAKRKRRYIRRDDLLAYLSGKLLSKPNSHQYHHHHHHHHRIAMSPRPRNISPPPGVPPPESLVNSELHTFREALIRSTLSTRYQRGQTHDLCTFITSEMNRHCKRPASPSDVTMDSPTQQKRPRYM